VVMATNYLSEDIRYVRNQLWVAERRIEDAQDEMISLKVRHNIQSVFYFMLGCVIGTAVTLLLV